MNTTIYELNDAYQRYQADHEIPLPEDSKLRNLTLQWEMRSDPDSSAMIFILFNIPVEPTESEFKPMGVSILRHVVDSTGETSIPEFLNDYI